MADSSITTPVPYEGNHSPIVTIDDGRAVTDTRAVAAYFGKNHRDVMRAVDNLLKDDPELALRNFAQGSYTLENTGDQQHRCYAMDRDGFTFLAMGFTGKKAHQFKKRYIGQFNAMEEELRRRASEPLDLDDPVTLRRLLLQHNEKTERLQKENDALVPKATALDKIATAQGSLCVTDTAKALQIRRSDLFNFLRQNHWIYRRQGTSHDLGYQSKVAVGYLEHKVTTVLRPDGTEKITEQVRITPKGMTKLALLLDPNSGEVA